MGEFAGFDTANPEVTRRRPASDAWNQFLAMLSPAGPWVLRVAATLRLADLIAGGHPELEELAVAARADADALRRLLRFLVARGIFSEPQPDRFKVNAVARLLMEEHPTGFRSWLDLEGAGGRMDRTWPALLNTIRTGTPAYQDLHRRTLWDDLASDPGLAASFSALMAAGASRIAPDVIDAYDWTMVGHVVDVGGGDGTLLARILRAHPGIRGTVVEIAATVVSTERFLADQRLSDRCTVIAGSFLDPLPAAADVYILANVLHDWSDYVALEILRNCAAAAATRGRVLILERVHDTGGADAREATEEDLRYLLLFGGRVRTESQFRDLAARAGMVVKSVTRRPSGLSLVACAPAGAVDLGGSQ